MHSTLGRAVVLAASAALLLGLLGCEPKDEEKEGPPLPSIETMSVDLTPFTKKKQATGALEVDQAADDAAGATEPPPTGEHAHFNNAKVRVGALNLWLAAAVVPPAVVFAIALTKDPVFEDGKWIWDFTAKNGKDEYRSRLSGWFEGGTRTGIELKLEVMVTCTACKVPTKDFVWYTGEFNTDGTNGHWQFYNPEITQEDKKTVRIGYDIRDEDKSLTIENLRSDGHENGGDTIAYVLEAGGLQISVHDESEKLGYKAGAVVETGVGWLEVPLYNGGEKACWDGDQKNVDCPAE